MKLTILFLTLCCLHVAAASYGQQVTLSEKDAPLEKVFKDITKQTGYIFFTEKNTLQGTNKVTLTLTNANLSETLQKVFAGQPLEYTIAGTTIAVKKKETPPAPKKSAEVGAPVDVIGRVTNKAGQPLDGATVTIKRTQSGVLTSPSGNFTIRNVLPNDTLVISYLGYARQFIKVGDKTSFNIILQEASNQLDQVVIQAYGETSQRLTTGNIGKVTAADIAKQPVMNVLDALQGQVAGVVVTNTSGYASGTVKVEIRGRNTINPNFPSDPLYIIDGVPLTILDIQNRDSYANGSLGVIQSGIASPAGGQSPFFSINPSDVESIEVLKDADATAIYGSRGSNGVILITTKKGKAGKTHFDMNVTTGISNVQGYYKMLNTQQYVSMREEALKNDGLPVDINNAADIVVGGTTRYTDWQKYLWGGLGKETDAEGSISGGDAQTTFRIGAGYRHQTDILTSNGADQRGSLSFNINHKSLNQRFSLVLSGNYTVASSDMINIPAPITLPPNAPPIYDNKGNLNFAQYDAENISFPFGNLLQPYSTKTNFLTSNMVLNYNIFKGLVLRTSLGYNNIQTNQTQYIPIVSQDPIYNPTGTAYFGYTFVKNLIVEPQIEYNNYLGKGKLDVLAGASSQTNSTNGVSLGGTGYTNDALLTSINNAPSKEAGTFLGQYKYASVFGRVNYNLEDKYILNLNARRDGSSRFGPGRQFGNFGSVGAAWIFSEENWVKHSLPFLSFGKLRGSFGVVGGDQTPNYQYLTKWAFERYPYNNSLPITPQSHTDSLIHWQVNHKLEGALDLGFLKDRLTLEVAWYRDQTSDQLVAFPTPAFSGFTNVESNSPADVENSGLEFVVNGKIVDNSNFKWSARLNIGINRNKLLSYPNLSQSPYADNFIIGQSLNIVRVLHYTGVDPQTGLYTFQDRNHDGQITMDFSDKTSDDRYPIDLSPKFDGGLTQNFSYKNWQLSILVYFKKQIGVNALASLDAPGDATNQPVSILNRWQNPGNITNTPRFTANPSNYGQSFQYFAASDAVFTDASFIRLQNLSISYTLPQTFLKKTGIVNCRAFVQGENLLLITKYNGLDPEVQNFGGLPFPRTMTLGLSCNF